MLRVYLCLLFLAVFALSCRKKADPVAPVATTGSVNVTYQNVAGAQPLVLNTGWYLTQNGDSIQLSLYKYYISNILLVKEDGTEVAEPESYHLVDEAQSASKSFTLTKLPLGNYKKIKFLIGVDEPRNTAGAQTGALDPIHGMFWTWDTGYIMAKLEGTSPQSSAANNRVIFHTGGFKGDKSVIRSVTLDFPQVLQVKNISIPNVHMKADMLEWFKTPNLVNLKTFSVAMAGDSLTGLANNYSDMFKVDHID